MTDRLAMPFLDSVGASDEHGPVAGALARPWMSYWPPEEGSDLHKMLELHVPEVLSWRFNPKNPFDRPWQSWTRSAILSGRVCNTTVLQPSRPNKDENVMAGSNEARVVDRGGSDIATKRSGIGAPDLPFVVPSQFNYLSENHLYDSTKPYHTRLPFMGQIRRTNIVTQGYSGVKIYDLGGQEEAFTLDKVGFQYFKVPSDITNWNNETAQHHYLPSMQAWLKSFFQASRVEIFTYTFRCENRDRTPTEAWVGPYMRAHCGKMTNDPGYQTCALLTALDVTLNSGLRRLDLHLPDEADEIRQGRWRMIGIWRALTGPHQDKPLAVLDSRTLQDGDLVGADVVFPHYCDEGYEVKYNPHHRWFYKQCMQVDDVLMFKLYDSLESTVRFCPHGSFLDPSVPDTTPQRASIEIRAIIID